MILKLANAVKHHGWLVLIAIFYPVYWSQDIDYHNCGYDTISLFKVNTAYDRYRYSL
jgi:hypothetical protein